MRTDLRLQYRSACIDAGRNAAIADDAFDLDGDGDRTELSPLFRSAESSAT
ncbi:MAG: hypothetical protein GY711_01765 [bacterium]|nr:hypothetical protein [bacterium]